MNNYNESEVILGPRTSNPILDSVKQKNTKKRYGLQFPFTRNQNGYFSKMADKEVVKSNLIQLIKTEPGERVMLPEFGCPLRSLLFAPFDREVIFEMRERIYKAISTYLPTVSIVNLKIIPVDEYKSNGLPTIKIFLICKILDQVDSIFDVKVSL